MGLEFYQTVSIPIDEPAERRAIRKHAEYAAGVHEADAAPERSRIASNRIEQARERLGRVHGIEHDALEACELQHRVELVAPHGRTAGALIAIEQPHLGGWPDGEPVAATRAI